MPASLSVPDCEARKLNAALVDGDNRPIAAQLQFESANALVADVSADGTVAGVSEGTTSIEVRGGGVSKVVPVTVTRGIDTVTADAPVLILAPGGATNSGLRTRNCHGQVVTDRATVFASTDESVARVNATGTVTAVAFGRATVTAALGSATFGVRVIVATRPVGNSVTSSPVDSRPFGVAVGRQGTVLVTRLDAGALTKFVSPAAGVSSEIGVGSVPTNVAFRPDGLVAYVTNQGDRTIGIVDLATGVQVSTIALPSNPFNLVYSAVSNRLFVTNNGPNVLIVDPETRAVVGSVPAGDFTNGIVANESGDRVFVSVLSRGELLEISGTTGTSVRTAAFGGAPQDLALTADGRQLIIADQGGSVRFWDVATWSQTASMQVGGTPFGLALSPDQSHVYVGLALEAQLLVIDRATRTLVRTIPVPNIVRKIAFSLAGDVAVVASEGGSVVFVR